MKILIGPLEESIKHLPRSIHVLGNYVNDSDIKVFFKDDYEKIDLIIDSFKPDIIMVWAVEYNAIPSKIHNYSNIITIGVSLDWHINFSSVKLAASFLDYIVTDQAGVNSLDSFAINNTIIWNELFGYVPDFHKPFELEKKYDISFVGSLNFDLQIERSKWIHRLKKLPDQYKVKVATNIFGDEYINLLNQSKITFNFSIRKEANMRSFEAFACQSLLFLEEENNSFKKEQNICIYYNKDNFEEKVAYYLNKSCDRYKITENAYDYVLSFPYEKNFYKLINLLKTKKLLKKTDKNYLSIFSHDLNSKFVKNTFQKPKVIHKNDYYYNEIGYYNFLLYLKYSSNKYLKKAQLNFEKSLKLNNSYITAIYNLSIIEILNNKFMSSIEYLLDLELKLNDSVYSLNLDSMIDINPLGKVIEHGFSYFKIEYERIMSQNSLSQLKVLINWKINYLLTLNYIKMNDFSNAKHYANKQLECRDDIYLTYEQLTKISLLMNDQNGAKLFLVKLKEINPLYQNYIDC